MPKIELFKINAPFKKNTVFFSLHYQGTDRGYLHVESTRAVVRLAVAANALAVSPYRRERR